LIAELSITDAFSMPTFIYRCPITGYSVQGFVPDDPIDHKDDDFRPITCVNRQASVARKSSANDEEMINRTHGSCETNLPTAIVSLFGQVGQFPSSAA